MSRLYETTIVIDPQLKSVEIEEVIKKVTDFITNHGGEIVKVEEWGKRRLAYEINKKQYGYYVHIRFNASGQLVHLLEREYRLSEAILRYLTIKVHKMALKMEEEARKRQEAEAAQAQEKAAEPAATEETETATEGEPVVETESQAGTEAAAEQPAAETPAAEETVAEVVTETGDSEQESPSGSDAEAEPKA
ncbi:MAG: 30S ribosomal protein S6 [Calditrichaeota bacterium]|nr:MAG: 30S ribosomal protein S6 [Calditrichota bacterium]